MGRYFFLLWRDCGQKECLIKVLSQPSNFLDFRAFRSEQPTGSVAKRFRNQHVSKLLKAFKSKHQPIAHYLCSDQGVKLMDIDGAIVAKVLKHFTDNNEPVLSVHDSFICRIECRDEVVRVMNEIVSDMLAGYIVGIKTNENNEDVTLKNKETILESVVEVHNQESACQGYRSRLKEHLAWINADRGLKKNEKLTDNSVSPSCFVSAIICGC